MQNLKTIEIQTGYCLGCGGAASPDRMHMCDRCLEDWKRRTEAHLLETRRVMKELIVNSVIHSTKGQIL